MIIHIPDVASSASDVQSVWSAVLNPDRVSCQESGCAQLIFWPTGEPFGPSEPVVDFIDLDGSELCSGFTRQSGGVIQNVRCRDTAATVCEFDCEDKYDWGKMPDPNCISRDLQEDEVTVLTLTESSVNLKCPAGSPKAKDRLSHDYHALFGSQLTPVTSPGKLLQQGIDCKKRGGVLPKLESQDDFRRLVTFTGNSDDKSRFDLTIFHHVCSFLGLQP